MRTLKEFRAALKRRAEDRALRKAPSPYGVALFDSIHYVNADAWDAVVPPERLFQQRRYLAALEACMPDDIAFRYAMLFDGNRPVAAINAQLIEMSGAAVGNRVAKDNDASSLKNLASKVRDAAFKAADKIETRVLLCGNAWVTGEHGFSYVADADPETIFDGLAEALYRMRRADKLDAVASKASLRLTTHPRHYFTALKQALGDQFHVFTYSLDDKIVGFRTTIHNHDSIEGHYLGLDYEHNTKHAIYQNILYDYVQDGIDARAKNLWLGRTALEIKSAIGAEARPMRCFLRHRNPVGNRAVKPLFKFIKPTPWTPRNPFDTTD